MKNIFKWLTWVPKTQGDQSKHRVHSHKYEDLCM